MRRELKDWARESLRFQEIGKIEDWIEDVQNLSF